MTKKEAKQAMQEGKKVTHKYFTDKEWITIVGDVIQDETGFQFNAYQFWLFRQSEVFDDGWSIWKE